MIEQSEGMVFFNIERPCDICGVLTNALVVLTKENICPECYRRTRFPRMMTRT